MTLRVSELSSADEGGWDTFVRGCPDALPHHLLGWREVITRTYSHRPRYLVAKDEGQVVGVMPLFEVPSRIEGYNFSTLPGGICASTEEAGYGLVQRAKELVRSSNARFLAIRDSRRQWDEELITHHSQCSIVIDVTNGSAPIRKAISYDVRRYLDRASKSGVTLSPAKLDLDRYFQVFSTFVRNRGTPVFPKTLLTGLADIIPNDTMFQEANYEGKMIGGTLNFLLGDTAFNILLFSLDEYHKLRINHFLYWDLVESACAQGLTRIDLGRSSIGSGQHQFKMRWGGVEVPIYQQFWLHRTKKIPTLAADAEDGNGRLVTRAWKRLPLPVTRVVGPLIRRELPFV